MSSARRQGKRRLETIGWHVDLGARVEQEPGYLDVTIHRGFHQGRVHLICLVFLVGAGFQQEANHLQVTLVAGQRQRRLLKLVRVRVDSGSVAQQDFSDADVAGGCSLHQRGVTVLIVVLNVSVRLEKNRDDFFVATGDNVYYIPGGGSSPTGALGYVNAAFELVRQFEEANEPFPEVIVVAAGTAGTYAGILLGLRWLGLPTRVVGVRVVERFVCNRALVIHLANQTADLLRSYGATGVPDVSSADVEIDHHQLGAGYGLSTDRGMHAIGIASRANGLVLEPTYTAKAFGSIIAHRKTWKGKRILYWHTLSGVDLSGLEYDPNGLPLAYSEFLEAI